MPIKTKYKRVFCKDARKHKLRFRHPNDARKYITLRRVHNKDDEPLRIYPCSSCGGYHLSKEPELGFRFRR